jgi:hypothetical protein
LRFSLSWFFFLYPCQSARSCYPSFSTFRSFLQLDLLAAVVAPWVCHGSCSPSGQTPIDRRKSTLTGADGAPDCRRFRRNRTIQFTKSDDLIFLFRAGAAFGSLFDSWCTCSGCFNTQCSQEVKGWDWGYQGRCGCYQICGGARCSSATGRVPLRSCIGALQVCAGIILSKKMNVYV